MLEDAKQSYRVATGKDFKWLDAWHVCYKEPKWRESKGLARQGLKRGGDGASSASPIDLADDSSCTDDSKGDRPVGCKKAKTEAAAKGKGKATDAASVLTDAMERRHKLDITKAEATAMHLKEERELFAREVKAIEQLRDVKQQQFEIERDRHLSDWLLIGMFLCSCTSYSFDVSYHDYRVTCVLQTLRTR